MSNLALQLIEKEKQEKTGKLDLRKCGLTYIPEELLELTGLQSLGLRENEISDYSSLEKLTGLQNLNLHYNKINDISSIEKLTDLKSLDLGGNNQISDISSLEKLINLQSLDLYGNQQINDYSPLEKLTALQRLYLGENKINDIRFLEKITSLRSLDLHGNHLISDYSPLEKLTNLESLNLYENLIKDIRFLEKLTGLQSLDLCLNSISDISSLEKLICLQNLRLGQNLISNYNSLEKLTGLQSLDLSISQISDISSLQRLTGLRSLNLSHTQINNISSLEKLIGLQTLNLGQNKISNISSLENLTGLRSLNLNLTQISDHNTLKNLIGLQELSLYSCQISDISFLENLTRLQTLNLGQNQISDIRLLENLTGLKFLNLSENKISDICSLEKLIGLQYLNLRQNQISDVSPLKPLLKKGIIISINRGGISIGENPLTVPPIEIVGRGREAVLDWFEATKKKLNEIKLILIGEPKVGKTSILRRLKYDTFDEHEVQTNGVNIEDIQFGDCDTFKNQTLLHNITGHFWDFGGQEIINATHQFFLSNRSIYLLVLDARKDDDVSTQIRNWVKRIKVTGGNSPIIIIANQMEVNPGFGFENEYELKKEFPQIKYFIKASCSTKENIDLIKEKLEELIPKAELFSTSIDEKWISIKEQLQLETKSQQFLNEERFLQICSEFELNEKRGQKNAISFLHDLGLVLHFENINLSEYYVLDPYWITYGIYQIMTSSYVGKNKGLVSMDKLEYIVNEEEDKEEVYRTANDEKIIYSINQRRFLIDILNQFKLCFYLPGHNDFIIPDLLDTNEPNKITEPIRKSEDSIRFVYEYEYLPKSTMPRIIVEAHQIQIGIWRTGCVLQHDGCNAIVSNYRNRISIIVNGAHKKKREFMSVLRHLIDTINQELTDKPRMCIPLPDTDKYVDYEELLEREKDREKLFTLYQPTKRQFEISVLLEGIPSKEEVSGNDIMLELKKAIYGIEEIKNKLDFHYQFLINLPDNNKIKDDILEALDEANRRKSEDLMNDITLGLADAFDHYNGEMKNELNKIYDDLKQTDNVQMKLKLSVPFINLLGVNLETEFDVKGWAQKMYSKHELKIFKVMGYL